MGELGSRYLAAQGRVVALVAPLPAEACEQRVPATPAWSVHDVVAHLSGICDDALAGNMAGAPGEAWTAAQVERGRGVPTADLLARWVAVAPAFAAGVEAGDRLPPVFDVLTHEQDLRGALGRPGVDPDDVTWAMRFLYARLGQLVEQEALPALRLVTESGDRVLGRGVAATTLRADDLELFRLTFGRRSAAQAEALDWDGDPKPYLPLLFVFGPAATDVAY